jgi:hypothetical protein
MMIKKVVYVEPADYIPKDLRKKYKLGEYADTNMEVDINVTVETKDGTINADGLEEVKQLIEELDN